MHPERRAYIRLLGVTGCRSVSELLRENTALEILELLTDLRLSAQEQAAAEANT